jgi:hypothetical protein
MTLSLHENDGISSLIESTLDEFQTVDDTRKFIKRIEQSAVCVKQSTTIPNTKGLFAVEKLDKFVHVAIITKAKLANLTHEKRDTKNGIGFSMMVKSEFRKQNAYAFCANHHEIRWGRNWMGGMANDCSATPDKANCCVVEYQCVKSKDIVFALATLKTISKDEELVFNYGGGNAELNKMWEHNIDSSAAGLSNGAAAGLSNGAAAGPSNGAAAGPSNGAAAGPSNGAAAGLSNGAAAGSSSVEKKAGDDETMPIVVED